MAGIVVEPVIAAITAVITGVIEKGTEVAVLAAITATVTEVVEAAVTSAISAAIAAGVVSSVTGAVTAATTEAVEAALEKSLSQAVKDVIGSRGVQDLSKAITAIPSEVAVDKLAQAAMDAINPHLWVFKDPAFFRLTRLIRTLRAIQKGEQPEEYDDDDCDEEKCRLFSGPEKEDNLEDFIFFTVYDSSHCEEGEEKYSMSAQWKKLKSLVDDPIGGHYVSQLFQEFFDSCADEEEEDAETSALVLTAIGVKKKIGKVKYGKIVSFGKKTVHNVAKSSGDKRSLNWLKTYFVHGYGKCGKCYIEAENPVCGHSDPLAGNIVGGHMWNPQLKKKDNSLYYYILPICKRHNKRGVYDKPLPDGSGWLKTSEGSFAMKITSTNKVPGWKSMTKKLTGSKKLMLMAKMAEGAECPDVPIPKNLTDWVMEEAHKIALEFSEGPIEVVFKEVSNIVLGKLKDIIKSAGSDAENWAKSEGHDIMLQSLIPIYGIYQAVKRLSSLQNDAIHRFHSKTQSGLEDYKNECLGSAEQGRRKQRLIEETDKIIASQKWKDRIVTFEGAIASKVSSLIDHTES